MNDLTEFNKYFIDFQTNYISRKRTKKELLEIDIVDLTEKWNRFVTISIDYFKYLLNFYDGKLSAVLANLININVLEYDISKINETKDLMEKYIILTHLIEAELEYYLTGTVYVKCDSNEVTMETFNNITINNQSLMNRSVDIKTVYGLKDNQVNFNAKLNLLKSSHDDEKKFSLLSINGIEFLYYQLITLLVYSEVDSVKELKKKLNNPTRKFEELAVMYTTLNDKNLIELKRKAKNICTKNQSFTLTVKNRNGSFRLVKTTKKVS